MKARPKNKDFSEVGQAIVAAWYKILPEQNPQKDPAAFGNIDTDELTTLFNQILDTKCAVRADPKREPGKDETVVIQVPQPPVGVYTRRDLLDYLLKYHNDPNSHGHHFHEDMGVALLFGCGK